MAPYKPPGLNSGTRTFFGKGVGAEEDLDCSEDVGDVGADGGGVGYGGLEDEIWMVDFLRDDDI